MIQDVINELQSAIEKAHDALRRDLGKLRTGRAHPSMLDAIRVSSYGTPTPLSQMAAVNVPEPRMLTIKPWERNQVQAIDKAIRESDLGFNPQVDGDLIRVPVPPLSEERRRDLTKLGKKAGEECKIAIRKVRHEAMDMLAELKSDGSISEDELDRAKKKVEEIVGQGTTAVDSIVSAKEKEIMTV